GDQPAVLIDLQLSGARVGDLAVGLLDLQEAATDDRHVERLPGRLQIAVGEYFLRAYQACAGAELYAGRRHGVVVVLCAGLTLDLIKQIFEDDPIALEAHGVDVGQVVGDRLQLRLLRLHAGLADPHCWIHVLSRSSFATRSSARQPRTSR